MLEKYCGGEGSHSTHTSGIMQIGANEVHTLSCITDALGCVSGKMIVEWGWLPCRNCWLGGPSQQRGSMANVVQSIELLQILLVAQIGRPYCTGILFEGVVS